jgi:hypothetical protein
MAGMFWLLLVTFLLIGFMLGGLLGAPWVPTRSYDVERLLDDTRLKEGETFIELGCGDGRLVAAAAKRGAKAVGYEINPLLWLIAWLRNLPYGSHASVRLGNFWVHGLGGADVVMVFLMPKFMPKLLAKANKEMKPKSRLASYIYKLPGKKPTYAASHWFIYKF